MKQIHLGVFEVAGPQVGGTVSWSHPRSDSARFAELDHWVRIARMLDQAGFDFLFFADGYGYPAIDGDLPEVVARNGINFPSLEPLMIVPALARETERLGFVVTSSTGLGHPLQIARSFATLDHVTAGRIGWNIVTGAMQNTVAELFGHRELVAHDIRYDIADEYLEVAMRYWEGCWADDALVADRASGLFAERSRLHRVEFEGRHFRSSGYLGVPPSPQRTPVLFQAGSSARGRAYAAANAECVFIQGTTIGQTAANVADIRAKAALAGRDPASIAIIVGVTAMVAPSRAKALALWNEFLALQSDETVAALYAGNTGIDLLALDPRRGLEQLFDGEGADAGGGVGGRSGAAGQMGQSNIDRFLGTPEHPGPTVAEILDELRGRATRGFRVVGDPVEVADEIERIIDATDLDGIMLEPVFDPADLEDFVALVLPELRARGRVPQHPDAAVGPITLRERMLGPGATARIRPDHPGARFRVG